MSEDDICRELETLDLAACKRLIGRIRARIGALVEPPPGFREKCRPGGTATAWLGHCKVTGLVEEVTGGCVLLRFATGEVAMTTADRLLDDGYGAPVTDLPPRLVYDTLPEGASPCRGDGVLPVLFNGVLYMPRERGDKITMACRVMLSAIPEYLPTAMLVELAEKPKGMGLCI